MKQHLSHSACHFVIRLRFSRPNKLIREKCIEQRNHGPVFPGQQLPINVCRLLNRFTKIGSSSSPKIVQLANGEYKASPRHHKRRYSILLSCLSSDLSESCIHIERAIRDGPIWPGTTCVFYGLAW